MMLQGMPSTDDFARIYYELGRMGARAVGRNTTWSYAPHGREALLCLAADMSRHDPRLFEVLVDYLLRHWRDVNPLRIRQSMRRMQTPQVFGVIGEFVQAAASDPEVEPFCVYLMHGYPTVPLQLFFHHLYPPGSRDAAGAAETSLAEFRRWGFLATERPVIAQAAKQTIGSYDAPSRRNILRHLLAEHAHVTVAQYRTALYDSISRQQAYLDLAHYPGLQRSGHGRGARWSLPPSA